MDRSRQADERRVVPQMELVHEHLEGAPVVSVSVGRSRRVEGAPTLTLGDLQHLVLGDVDDLGLGVDAAADQPRAGDPVGLRSLSCHPLHRRPPSCLPLLAPYYVPPGAITRRTGLPFSSARGRKTWCVAGSTATVWAFGPANPSAIFRRVMPSAWKTTSGPLSAAT